MVRVTTMTVSNIKLTVKPLDDRFDVIILSYDYRRDTRKLPLAPLVPVAEFAKNLDKSDIQAVKQALPLLKPYVTRSPLVNTIVSNFGKLYQAWLNSHADEVDDKTVTSTGDKQKAVTGDKPDTNKQVVTPSSPATSQLAQMSPVKSEVKSDTQKPDIKPTTNYDMVSIVLTREQYDTLNNVLTFVTSLLSLTKMGDKINDIKALLDTAVDKKEEHDNKAHDNNMKEVTVPVTPTTVKSDTKKPDTEVKNVIVLDTDDEDDTDSEEGDADNILDEIL